MWDYNHARVAAAVQNVESTLGVIAGDKFSVKRASGLGKARIVAGTMLSANAQYGRMTGLSVGVPENGLFLEGADLGPNEKVQKPIFFDLKEETDPVTYAGLQDSGGVEDLDGGLIFDYDGVVYSMPAIDSGRILGQNLTLDASVADSFVTTVNPWSNLKSNSRYYVLNMFCKVAGIVAARMANAGEWNGLTPPIPWGTDVNQGNREMSMDLHGTNVISFTGADPPDVSVFVNTGTAAPNLRANLLEAPL